MALVGSCTSTTSRILLIRRFIRRGYVNGTRSSIGKPLSKPLSTSLTRLLSISHWSPSYSTNFSQGPLSHSFGKTCTPRFRSIQDVSTLSTLSMYPHSLGSNDQNGHPSWPLLLIFEMACFRRSTDKGHKKIYKQHLQNSWRLVEWLDTYQNDEAQQDP